MILNATLTNDSLHADPPLSCTPGFKSSAHLSARWDFITPTPTPPQLLTSVLKIFKKRVKRIRKLKGIRWPFTLLDLRISSLITVGTVSQFHSQVYFYTRRSVISWTMSFIKSCQCCTAGSFVWRQNYFNNRISV